MIWVRDMQILLTVAAYLPPASSQHDYIQSWGSSVTCWSVSDGTMLWTVWERIQDILLHPTISMRGSVAEFPAQILPLSYLNGDFIRWSYGFRTRSLLVQSDSLEMI